MSKEKQVKIVTPTGRICFHKNLFSPNKKNKYSAALVFEKSQDLSAIEKALKEAAKLAFGDEYNYEKEVSKGKIKVGFHEVDEDNAEKYPYLEGKITLNGSSGFAIPVVTTQLGPDGKTYEQLYSLDEIKAGDYCRFSVAFKGMTVEGTKAIACYLQGIQWIKEGEPFYSRGNATTLFSGQDFDVDPEQASF